VVSKRIICGCRPSRHVGSGSTSTRWNAMLAPAGVRSVSQSRVGGSGSPDGGGRPRRAGRSDRGVRGRTPRGAVGPRSRSRRCASAGGRSCWHCPAVAGVRRGGTVCTGVSEVGVVVVGAFCSSVGGCRLGDGSAQDEADTSGAKRPLTVASPYGAVAHQGPFAGHYRPRWKSLD
jgi:hypothetical protein